MLYVRLNKVTILIFFCKKIPAIIEVNNAIVVIDGVKNPGIFLRTLVLATQWLISICLGVTDNFMLIMAERFTQCLAQ